MEIRWKLEFLVGFWLSEAFLSFSSQQSNLGLDWKYNDFVLTHTAYSAVFRDVESKATSTQGEKKKERKKKEKKDCDLKIIIIQVQEDT